MKLVVCIVTLWLLALSGVVAYAQDTLKKPVNKFTFELEGMIMVACNDRFYAFSVGGPNLMVRITNSFKIGVGAFPSFYVKDGLTGAKLGVSPRVDFKQFSFVVPFYHFESSGRWQYAFGLAYRFNHLKKH